MERNIINAVNLIENITTIFQSHIKLLSQRIISLKLTAIVLVF